MRTFLLLSLMVTSVGTAAAETLRVVPGAAHVEGVAGSAWQTDVWLYNGRGADVEVTIQRLPSSSSTCIRPAVVPESITVEAGSTRAWRQNPIAQISAKGVPGIMLIPPDVRYRRWMSALTLSQSG